MSPGSGMMTGVGTPTSSGDGTRTGVNAVDCLMRVGTTRGAGRGFGGEAGTGAGGGGSKFNHGVGAPPTSPGAGQPAGVHPASLELGSEMSQAKPAPSVSSPATMALMRMKQPSTPEGFYRDP